jgi:uncharacterized RDD family membrane protein YckC
VAYGFRRPAGPGWQSQAASFPYPMRPSGDYAPRPRAVLPPYAGWWRRALGLFIDLVVVFGPAAVLVLVAVALGANAAPGAARTLGITLLVLLAVAAIATAVTLQTRAEGSTGQTVGRRATGTRLVGYYDGLPIGALRSLGRFLAHVADHGFCYIGFIWPLWDKHKQTFADKIMDTVVVKANP